MTTTVTAPTELRIGRVISVQVPRREVRIAPETDVPARFEALTVARFRDARGGLYEWPVKAFRTAGRNVVLVLEGPDDAQLAALRKSTMVIPPEERGELPADRFFLDDVMGAQVVDRAGTVLGSVTGVMDAREYSLIEVAGGDGRAYTIACVPEHVLDMDGPAGRVVVDPAYLLNEDGHAY